MAYCFAWDQSPLGKWSCRATIMSCDGKDESCPFFKTPEQHRADREEALKRIASLPDWQQTAISEMHYSGTKPWMQFAPKKEEAISDVMGVV